MRCSREPPPAITLDHNCYNNNNHNCWPAGDGLTFPARARGTHFPVRIPDVRHMLAMCPMLAMRQLTVRAVCGMVAVRAVCDLLAVRAMLAVSGS